MAFRAAAKISLRIGRESAEIADMANRNHVAEIYAVIQFGGSSHEYYLHSFSEERSAAAYIRKAERASYRCIGPFEILLPAEGDLVRIAIKTVKWLKKEGYRNDEHTLDLERAVLEVQKDLHLS